MTQMVRRAELLMQQSRFELAEEQLKSALIQDANDAHAHALLAICLTARDAFPQATAEAAQGIHFGPDIAFSHFAMAVVMQARNRLAEARTAIGEAIRLDPLESRYYGRLAAIESGAGLWNDALAAAEKGLELDPENIQCTNQRSFALTSLGRNAEAGQSIQEALLRDPDNAVTHANEGWRLLHDRRPRPAMEHFREALRLSPNLERARLGIVEAMKARNFIYRWLLAFFLWVNRFPPKVQIMLVIGLVVGNNILHAVTTAIPAVAPFGRFVTIGYVLFVWATWSASALFNLVLWTNPFGRLALNANEKREAALCGASVLVAVLGCLASVTVWSDFPDEGLMSSLLFLGLVIPIVTTFRARGNRRLVAVAWTVGVAALVVSSFVLWIIMPLRLNAFQRTLISDPQDLAEVEAAVGELSARLQGLNGDEVLAVIAKHPEQRVTRMLDFMIDLTNQHFTVWQYGLLGVVLSTWLGFGLSRIPQRR